MYWNIYIVVFILVCLQMVSSQVSVSRDFKKVECGERLILTCTYTGGINCCNDSTRLWFKDNTQILSDGASTPTGKYSEKHDWSNKRFSLVINDVGPSDYDTTYQCSYALTTSSIYINWKTLEHFCPPTPKCGGICFGLATAPFVCIDIIAILVFLKKHGSKQIHVAALLIVPGLLLSFVVSFFSCTFFVYDCYGDYSNAIPWMLVGIISCLIYLAVTYCIIMKRGAVEVSWTKIVYFVTCGLAFIAMYKSIWEVITAIIGENTRLPCPYKAASGQIIWFKKNGKIRETYSEGRAINQNLPQNLRERFKVDGQDLCISDVKQSDAGIYECVLCPKPNKVPQGSKLKLTVSGGGKNQSVESGSSCWPICRVGQDPNTSSSGPENVRRSPKKERADKKPTDFARSPENERADKKKERKPTEVVRPQPTRPLPPMHLKTDNTGRAEYSTETEIFKPPALPSINKASDSPRPLPQKPPGTQLDPLRESTSERKKKKKRKKKEAKQSDEEN